MSKPDIVAINPDDYRLPIVTVTQEDVAMAIQVVRQLESLEGEYNAYHTKSDYWRGIKYAIDVLRRG